MSINVAQHRVQPYSYTQKYNNMFNNSLSLFQSQCLIFLFFSFFSFFLSFFNFIQDNLTVFHFIFQNSNIKVISQFQWLILAEEQIM